MKRQLAVLASGVVASGLFVSGATAFGARQAPIVIQLWDMQQSAKSIGIAENKAIKQFEAQNPGVQVKLTIIPYAQYQDKLLVAAKGGTAPDVASLDEVWTPQYAAAGVIQPLDTYLNSKSATIKSSQFFSGAWNTVLYQGKTWAIPLSFDVWEQLYYNADLFKKAGLNPNNPPKTWDQFLADAKKLTKAPNQFGVALIGHKGEDTSVMLDSLLYSNGGNILDKNGSVTLNSSQNIKTMEFFKQLSQYAPKGVANAAEGDTDNLFTSGKVAMILDGEWQQDTMKAQAPNTDWRIAVPPAPAGHNFIGALGGWNMAVFKSSQHPDIAFKLIEFLSQKKVEESINSLVPARKDAGIQFVKQSRKQPDGILTTLSSGEPRPISPIYPQLSDVEQQMVQNVWSGMSVSQAISQAAQGMEQVIKQNQ